MSDVCDARRINEWVQKGQIRVEYESTVNETNGAEVILLSSHLRCLQKWELSFVAACRYACRRRSSSFSICSSSCLRPASSPFCNSFSASETTS